MDQHILGVFIMVVASIIIGYYFSMTVLLRKDKTNNRNKLYQSLLMGAWMGAVELLMVGFLMKTWDSIYSLILIVLVFGIVGFTFLIREQRGINENQFLTSMIEHHSMGIEMAKKAKPKIQTREVGVIVDNIMSSQQEEINQMYDILKRKGVPNGFSSLFY